ncbi:MAG: type II secretion system F family protein [bacterium]
MSNYTYKARDTSGKLVEGEIEAASEHLVYESLNNQGLSPVGIKIKNENSVKIDFSSLFAGFQRVKSRDLSVLFRQLSTIFSAGVPLFEALIAIEEQISSKSLKKVVVTLRTDVEEGLNFSQALGKHPRVFSNLVVTMVKAGEQGGVLADVLSKISVYLELENSLQQKIRSALRYPILVLITLAGAFTMAVTFIVPKFSSIFGSAKTQLPLPTRILLSINYVVIHFWWMILIVGFGAYAGFKYYLQTRGGRWQWDQLQLKLPVFGLLNNKLALSRFFRMLSAMISSGIPLVAALEVTANTAGNAVVSDTINQIREKIIGGSSMSDAMGEYPLFPATSIHMAAIGEKSGNLGTMLLKSADYFDEETDYMVTNLMTLLEPFLILFLAMLVLLLAMGIFLPMWSMMQLYS